MRVQRKYVGVVLVLALLSASMAQTACSPTDVSKVKKKVADAAAILNTAAKSNRSLYQSGVYGAVGSVDAIKKRQDVATAIHQANEFLSMAVEQAANLTAADLAGGKQAIAALLTKAVQVLQTVHVANQNIELILTSAVTAINAAITLTLAIKGT